MKIVSTGSKSESTELIALGKYKVKKYWPKCELCKHWKSATAFRLNLNRNLPVLSIFKLVNCFGSHCVLSWTYQGVTVKLPVYLPSSRTWLKKVCNHGGEWLCKHGEQISVDFFFVRVALRCVHSWLIFLSLSLIHIFLVSQIVKIHFTFNLPRDLMTSCLCVCVLTLRNTFVCTYTCFFFHFLYFQLHFHWETAQVNLQRPIKWKRAGKFHCSRLPPLTFRCHQTEPVIYSATPGPIFPEKFPGKSRR